MSTPKYIFDILSRLETSKENLYQILDEFQEELSQDQKLYSF